MLVNYVFMASAVSLPLKRARAGAFKHLRVVLNYLPLNLALNLSFSQCWLGFLVELGFFGLFLFGPRVQGLGPVLYFT